MKLPPLNDTDLPKDKDTRLPAAPRSGRVPFTPSPRRADSTRAGSTPPERWSGCSVAWSIFGRFTSPVPGAMPDRRGGAFPESEGKPDRGLKAYPYGFADETRAKSVKPP